MSSLPESHSVSQSLVAVYMQLQLYATGRNMCFLMVVVGMPQLGVDNDASCTITHAY